MNDLKNKFKYWFDNQMAKGSLTLIKFLFAATILVILLITGLIFIFQVNDGEGFIYILWESFSTTINAWMPSSEDGDLLYVILMAIAALSGLMVTSVLIGIFTSAIEEKINNLKLGNSIVMEENHIVILGFSLGQYTLLNELITSCEDESSCIVIASNLARDEMEEAIRDNCEVGKNIRIICRTIDIFDPVALDKLSISKSKSIIVSVQKDWEIVKTILAVCKLLEEYPETNINISALVSNKNSILPDSYMQKNHIKMLRYNQTIAKIIAHACCQPGIAEAFEEILDFDGYNFYLKHIPETIGMSFMELSLKMDYATPLGIYKNDICHLNPAKDTIIEKDDAILFIANKDKPYTIHESSIYFDKEDEKDIHYEDEPVGQIAIIGINDQLDDIIDELPEDANDIIVLGDANAVKLQLSEENLERITIFEGTSNKKNLEKLAKESKHIILLSPDIEEDDEADFECITNILNLRDIRERFQLDFNITAEMRKESNQMLILENDSTDFVVSSNMSSLFLAQLSQNPKLHPVFNELLSNTGNEIYIRNAAQLNCLGPSTFERLRKMALQEGFIILGFMDDEHPDLPIQFDLSLKDTYNLTENDRFVVISNN